MNCLLQVTTPGTAKYPPDHPLMQSFVSALKGKGIDGMWVDTVSAWGCLNQDWFEFYAEVKISFGWCYIVAFSVDEWNVWFDKFHNGELLMQLHYVTEVCGRKSFIAHN